MKKLFAFLAASLIAVSMVPAVSAAESTSSDNTVYYYVDREEQCTNYPKISIRK